MNTVAGTLSNGRYHLLERLATGGMGEVWRASDQLLDREIAIKILKEEYAADASFRARFRAEETDSPSPTDTSAETSPLTPISPPAEGTDEDSGGTGGAANGDSPGRGGPRNTGEATR